MESTMVSHALLERGPASAGITLFEACAGSGFARANTTSIETPIRMASDKVRNTTGKRDDKRVKVMIKGATGP